MRKIYSFLLPLIALVALLVAPTMRAVAQEPLSVSGIITDAETNEPLVGVSVTVKNKPQIGAVSDIDGKYRLKTTKGSKLIFEYISMKSKTVEVKGKKLNVALESDNIMLEQVVSIGYTTVRKKELTGATAHVDSERLGEFVATDLGEALQGLVPGLSITSSGGDPGAAANVQIRGVSSLAADNNPLYVIDGVPQIGIPDINSNEIASIDILKDAASAAIYGTRGAAGVILITTKQGESGELKITFDSTIAFPQARYNNLPDLMNSAEQTYHEMSVYRIQGLAPNDEMDTFTYDQVKDQMMFQYDNNAVNTVLQSGVPVEQLYSLSMSGGMKQLTYSGVVSYTDQDGIIINSGYDRLSLRANINYRGKTTSISQSFSFMTDTQEKAQGGSIASAISMLPYFAPVERDMTEYVLPDDDESSGLFSVISKLLRTYNSKNITEKNKFSYNASLTQTITKALSFVVQGSLSTQDSFGFSKTPKVAVYNINGFEFGTATSSTNSVITNTAGRRIDLAAHAGFNYKQKFGKHNIAANALVSLENNSQKGFSASKRGLMGDLDVLESGTMLDKVGSSTYYTTSILGLIGRVQYDYASKYLFSASLRADASSKFSPKNRWGYFPSASAGWNISEEKFWKPIKNVVSNTKIRVSYGTTGNENFSPYTYQDVLHLGYDYVLGGDTYYGYTATAFPNYEVKWETTTQMNLGIDMGFLSNKWLFVADFYRTQKQDMLATVRLPMSVGTGTSTNMIQNVGNMLNTGMELGLTYRKTFANKLSLSTSINFYQNYNQITDLGTTDIMYNPTSTIYGSDSNSVTTAFAKGYEAGAFFLYQHEGVINNQTKLAEYRKVVPTAQMGDMMYRDVNGDNLISDDDRVYCGSGFADFEMGYSLNLKWKNFDFNTQLFASFGNKIMNGLNAYSYNVQRNSNLLEMWTPENPNSNVPTWRGSSASSMNYIGYSDVWLEDGSYLRLKLASLGYTIKPKKSGVISSARVYVSGQNILTLTKYSGLDPEVGGNGLTTRGVDKGGYPIPRKFIVGVKLNF